MNQQHNCGPSRRGAGNRDETTAAGRAGYERNMLEFIRRWHRFGGGSTRDIYVSLVLLSTSFLVTLELLQTGLFAEMTDETVEYIRKVCRWRVSTAGS